MTAIEHEPAMESELPPDDSSLISFIKSGLQKAGVHPVITKVDEQTTHVKFGEEEPTEPTPLSVDGQ